MNNKRGQFYLIAAIILIAMILSLVTVANKSRTQNLTHISEAAEEISIEAEAIMNYGISHDEDLTAMNTRFKEFTENYSPYSNVENLYFLYGDQSGIQLGAYRKLTPAQIFVNGFGRNVINDTDTSTTHIPSGSPPTITITIDDLDTSFEIKEGYNFYFILSQGNEETEEYLFSGNVVKEIEK